MYFGIIYFFSRGNISYIINREVVLMRMGGTVRKGANSSISRLDPLATFSHPASGSLFKHHSFLLTQLLSTPVIPISFTPYGSSVSVLQASFLQPQPYSITPWASLSSSYPQSSRVSLELESSPCSPLFFLHMSLWVAASLENAFWVTEETEIWCRHVRL